MTTPTIRYHCAALAIDVSYLLMCIEDGSSDPITLQEISDRANTVRDLLAAEPAGEGPTPAEIDELTQQHTSDLGDLRIGIAPEDVPALVHAALARWGKNGKMLDQCAAWMPTLEAWDRTRWHPIGSRLVPPAVLADVEAWLRGRPVGEVEATTTTETP
jgi:hypothetical protein